MVEGTTISKFKRGTGKFTGDTGNPVLNIVESFRAKWGLNEEEFQNLIVDALDLGTSFAGGGAIPRKTLQSSLDVLEKQLAKEGVEATVKKIPAKVKGIAGHFVFGDETRFLWKEDTDKITKLMGDIGKNKGDASIGNLFRQFKKANPNSNIKIEDMQDFVNKPTKFTSQADLPAALKQADTGIRALTEETAEEVAKPKTVQDLIKPIEKEMGERQKANLIQVQEYTEKVADKIVKEVGTPRKLLNWMKKNPAKATAFAGPVIAAATISSAFHLFTGTVLTGQGVASTFTWAGVDNIAGQGGFYFTELKIAARENPERAAELMALMEEYDKTVQVADEFINLATASTPVLMPAQKMIKEAFNASVQKMAFERGELQNILDMEKRKEEMDVAGINDPGRADEEGRVQELPPGATEEEFDEARERNKAITLAESQQKEEDNRRNAKAFQAPAPRRTSGLRTEASESPVGNTKKQRVGGLL